MSKQAATAGVLATPPALAWVGLGANLGDAPQTLSAALEAMQAWPHSRLEAASPLYRSSPVDADGPDYTNAVIRLCTHLAPLDLLHALQALEQAAGRLRPYRNAPRSLDLDLLCYEAAAQPVLLATPELSLPHPRMHERAFVLRPLHHIDPAKVTAAQLQATQEQLLEPLASTAQWRWSEARL